MRDTVIAIGIVAVAVVLIGFLIWTPFAKLEICSAYYPEVSRLSCFLSNYGLPQRGSK